MTDLHECFVPRRPPGDPYCGGSEAIDRCYEQANGHLCVDNGEYQSLVNFCPWCGFKAKRRADGTEAG